VDQRIASIIAANGGAGGEVADAQMLGAR